MAKDKEKPYLRKLRDKLIEKSGGRTMATQEKQMKKLGIFKPKKQKSNKDY